MRFIATSAASALSLGLLFVLCVCVRVSEWVIFFKNRRCSNSCELLSICSLLLPPSSSSLCINIVRGGSAAFVPIGFVSAMRVRVFLESYLSKHNECVLLLFLALKRISRFIWFVWCACVLMCVVLIFQLFRFFFTLFFFAFPIPKPHT